ncbi:hypothetical protein ACFE04_029560 [Oxalis oulophora]
MESLLTSSCPLNSIIYNTTSCTCSIGQLVNTTTNSCGVFNGSLPIVSDSFVQYSGLSFPQTSFIDFDSIRKFTQSQAVFLEATLVMLLSWLVFCFCLRFVTLGDGKSVWFKMRWWISRFDVCFATRHWLDDQKVMVKRKTELGGAFSIASWMLFIGLFATLLYQVIAKRSIEVHNVKAANGPDLMAFHNDMIFNITTISSMSCANLRGIGSVLTGQPGFMDQKSGPLSDFVNYTCHNSSVGPTLSFQCNNCQFVQDFKYISWWFVDLPNNPAEAVGFYFNLTAKDHYKNKYMSFVSGTLRNGSTLDDSLVTFRGQKTNILQFNLFPRLYRNLHDLRLFQPLFHDFIPGSNIRETAQLQTSLINPSEGLVNMTLFINFLSSYMVEIENESIIGPVSFLAELGGLYCFSIGIFFYLLVQCEYRIKRLRNEDSILRHIRNRHKAQKHWDTLRKYVMYTWGCKVLNDENENNEMASACCTFSIPSPNGTGLHSRSGSSRRFRPKRADSLSLNKKFSLANEKSTTPGSAETQKVKSFTTGTASNTEGQKRNESLYGFLSLIADSKAIIALAYSRSPFQSLQLKNEALGPEQEMKILSKEVSSEMQARSPADDNCVPPLPPLELKGGSELNANDIQRNFQQLYDYNMMLHDKLVATQSLIHSLTAKSTEHQP